MPKIVQVAGVGNVEFPDDMDDAAITHAIETEIIPGANPRPMAKDAAIPKPLIADEVEPDLSRAGEMSLEGAKQQVQGYGHALKQMGVGAGKGVISTGYHVAKMLGLVDENPAFEEALQGSNLGQKAGKIVEQGAEFMAGEGAALQGAKAIPLLAKAPLAAGIVAGAASGAGVTAAQGGDAQAVATNAAIGGAAPVVAAGLGAAVTKLGQKIQNSIIRPSVKDAADGFQIGTIDKYDLGGSLNQMAEKTHEAITERAAMLQDALAAGNAQGAKVDALQAITDAKQEFLGKRSGTFGLNKRIGAAFDALLDDLADIAPSGKVDLVTAQHVKRATGQLGAWQSGARDPEATAMEHAANAVYSKLKTAIEDAVPNAQVAVINKQLGELIPVERAIIRRIPVQARNNALSLGDIVMLGNGRAVGFVANKALKSGRVGAAAVKAGKGAVQGAIKGTATIAQSQESRSARLRRSASK